MQTKGFLYIYLCCMMTSSNVIIFPVTGPLCREFTGPGEFPAQRPVTRSFDVFFDLRLNKRLSKQPWGWWFETPSWSLWRQCNGQKEMGCRGSSNPNLVWDLTSICLANLKEWLSPLFILWMWPIYIYTVVFCITCPFRDVTYGL